MKKFTGILSLILAALLITALTSTQFIDSIVDSFSNGWFKPAGTVPVQGGNKSGSNSRDLTLLARAINGEARGEPYTGAVAVGAVIMNRTRDPKFPNTVAGVVYQPGAFTAVTDGQIDAEMEERSKKAAQDALNGWDPTGGAIYYYNPAKTTNKWIWSRLVIKVIGKHRFCK